MNSNNFRTIQSIGRSELISELTEAASVHHEKVVKGVGDDTAVTEADKDHFSLLTSETFMEGVNFDLTYTPLHHLGYKVVSAAVSDIYAMNGAPETGLINLAVPNKLSVDMLKQIYKGIYAAGKDYGLQITGGDLTASHATLAITVTAVGVIDKSNIAYRSGAMEGDLICISGDLGGATAGLRILMREKQFWEEQKDSEQKPFQPDLDEYEYVVQRQLLPLARRDIIQQFSEHEIIPHAMIDITQGLVSELKKMTKASGCGAQIYQNSLPIALETRTVADEMKEDVDKYALYGGEDFELMFAVPEEEVNDLSDDIKDFSVIGEIVDSEQGVIMQTAEGDLVQFNKN
jgi:thiamine-monophosphate kinase